MIRDVEDDGLSIHQPAKRMTRQKRAIQESVLNRCDHPTAQEIHRDLSAESIGLATVYRNLSNMVRDGTLSVVEHEGELRYDCNLKPHAHATCVQCGALWDIPLPAAIEQLHSSSQLAAVERVDLTLHGRCEACR
jgi:Fur family peroxide stress response transcriptional regulator